MKDILKQIVNILNNIVISLDLRNNIEKEKIAYYKDFEIRLSKLESKYESDISYFSDRIRDLQENVSELRKNDSILNDKLKSNNKFKNVLK